MSPGSLVFGRDSGLATLATLFVYLEREYS